MHIFLPVNDTAFLESAGETKVFGWTGYQTHTSAHESDALPTELKDRKDLCLNIILFCWSNIFKKFCWHQTKSGHKSSDNHGARWRSTAMKIKCRKCDPVTPTHFYALYWLDTWIYAQPLCKFQRSNDQIWRIWPLGGWMVLFTWNSYGGKKLILRNLTKTGIYALLYPHILFFHVFLINYWSF